MQVFMMSGGIGGPELTIVELGTIRLHLPSSESNENAGTKTQSAGLGVVARKLTVHCTSSEGAGTLARSQCQTVPGGGLHWK